MTISIILAIAICAYILVRGLSKASTASTNAEMVNALITVLFAIIGAIIAFSMGFI